MNRPDAACLNCGKDISSRVRKDQANNAAYVDGVLFQLDEITCSTHCYRRLMKEKSYE